MSFAEVGERDLMCGQYISACSLQSGGSLVLVSRQSLALPRRRSDACRKGVSAEGCAARVGGIAGCLTMKSISFLYCYRTCTGRIAPRIVLWVCRLIG